MAKAPREIDALTHDAARRINVPTAEMASLFEQQQEILGGDERKMIVTRPRPLANGEEWDRDPDLDPQIVWNGARIRITKEQLRQLAETGEVELGDAQLVWRGKDRQDWSDLVVNAPPIYVQEKVHPKAIIDDLKRRSDARREAETDAPDLFADFNGITEPEARAEFYQHAQHWTNRFILGDSLQVMASLAEREAMRGKVQCVYFDPPYGIKFNSNWQVSTQSRDVKDGKKEDVSREPEQVKAFRDTWKDGIHSYLTYLRDRLMVARELLTESGSIFVQIGDENVHRVRAAMDEVFGQENCVSQITVRTTTGRANAALAEAANFILWYAKCQGVLKYRPPFQEKSEGSSTDQVYSRIRNKAGQYANLTAPQRSDPTLIPDGFRVFRPDNLTSSRPAGDGDVRHFHYHGNTYRSGKGTFKTELVGLTRLGKSDRLWKTSGGTLQYIRYFDDFPLIPLSNIWTDTGTGSFTDDKIYVVQTGAKIVQRCILMTTDPGDLVLDPTCGSGTTATVSEQWGRRWVTIDTSRVALALARTRLMSARYPFYMLADTPEGRDKEREVSGKIQTQAPTSGDIRQGFVYERAPHITLKSIANNAEIDVISEKWQAELEPLRNELSRVLGRNQPWQEWEVPREAGDPWTPEASSLHTKLREAIADDNVGKKSQRALAKINAILGRDYSFDTLPKKPLDPWSNAEAVKVHAEWWKGRIARQEEIDASIARAADVEMLYDRPYEDKSKVRVAGPFTVESLSPHRIVTARDDTLGAEIKAGDGALQPAPANVPEIDFGRMVLEHLRSAGVHQLAKADTIRFNSVEPWPGNWLAAKGIYTDGDGREKQAGILIGPEFGTLTRSQITAAAREASEARFDALIACAFNFEAQASDINRLGPLPILKARMNPDLHMADELKNTGKGNLFVVFGEPDVDLIETAEGELQVKVNGVDIFDPSTGEIRSDDVKGIAAWFIDTDYNAESFFVRHAYFLGANDPYKSLKTALKAEIDEDAWQTLYSDTSRPFPRPATGRIAVKVINHFGDEVLKVFGV
ncbi:site-specific DNA-methyltransferase [Mesorhizobium sp.]|uniref:site-specific DNA-methyltransferase n=1 Tax=Mesorhizobium sp. TaxID=1871066 RepID=UPI0025F8692F|nr:site-specific DNA-methyltransferase [Mesorhizobium sp.]